MTRRWLVHLLAWSIGIAAFRVVLVAPQSCEPVTAGDLHRAIDLSASWASSNVGEDGTFTYRYDRSTGEDLGGYNQVRHAALVNALYQAVVSGEEQWLSTADAGFSYMRQRLVSHDDWVAFAQPGAAVQLGSTALMVASAVHRLRATGESVNDDLIHAGSRFLIAQQDASGAPAAEWSRTTRSPVPNVFGPFATGESAWALALADTEFPGQGYGEAADDVLSYIVGERRSREDRILRLPDHWASYALGERSTHRDLKPDEVQYVARLGGDFALMTRVESQRTGEGIQGFVRYGHALGAGVGALGEGIAGLWRVAGDSDAALGRAELAKHDLALGRAELAKHDLALGRAELAKHIECVASILIDRQVGAEDVVSDSNSEVGAWFRNDVTQMDDQQHTLSALVLARTILFPVQNDEQGDS